LMMASIFFMWASRAGCLHSSCRWTHGSRGSANQWIAGGTPRRMRGACLLT